MTVELEASLFSEEVHWGEQEVCPPHTHACTYPGWTEWVKFALSLRLAKSAILTDGMGHGALLRICHDADSDLYIYHM